ncbi:uncharacterized protein LOC129916145 isoform X2 [Episyrphus balteatus]|nr:uncharacterized protein LOC129916145 isoform X2 [Episyrphus balteatus]
MDCREYKYSVLKLIEAVRVRPELWDSSRAEFRSYKNKDNVWQDVFAELDDNYRLLSEKEQSVIAIKITTKWRNIRDVFIRSIKKRATDTKMRKYMYHDRLSFMLKLYKSYLRPESPVEYDKTFTTYLEPYNDKRATRSITFDKVPECSLVEKPKSSYSGEEESLSIKSEPDYENDEEITNNIENEASSSSKPNHYAVFDDEFEGTSCSENQTVDVENDHAHQHQITENKKQIQLSIRNKKLENVTILRTDEDEAFLASILSSVQDMSVDEKLEFRIAVLQKISQIRAKRHKT